MITVLAISLDRKFQLTTNGNHAYWVRASRGRPQFVGRTPDDAVRMFILTIERGY